MLLKINDNQHVSELQDKFNECFPFLKIEFYQQKHKWQEASGSGQQVSPEALVGDIRKNHNSGILEIKSWQKTGVVEQNFREKFGLNVQVFRSQGHQWVPTTATDELTLQQQAEIAQRVRIKEDPSLKIDEMQEQ